VVISGLKKEPTAKGSAVSPVASSLATTSINNRFDSTRAASTSQLDAVQLRQPVVNLQRHGESAVSRLALKTARPNPQLGSDSASDTRLGSDSANNQRVIEWQMRNQMATGTENQGQVPRHFENEASPTLHVSSEQKLGYYSARPQSQLVEAGYVTSGPTKTASHYDQQSAISAQPQFSHVANMRPQIPEMRQQPLPGMVPQDVHQSGPNRHSNLPGVRQQPPVFGKSVQYRPPEGASSPTLATVSSEQKPGYYSARPQSQLLELGYVTSGPTKTASPLPQSTSVPVVTDSVVGNRVQTSFSHEQQSSALTMSSSIGTPVVYSDDQRYKPQQMQPSMYGQQSAISAQPQFNQMANVRPQMPEMVRQPLPEMVPQDVYHSGPSRHSNLPVIHQQPVVRGSGIQYQPPGGQYGVQGATSNMVMSPPGVQHDLASVGGRMPAVSGADGMPVHSDSVHYVGPDISDSRSVPPQIVRYEMANAEIRAVPAGVPFSNGSRPYAASEGVHRPPHVEGTRPADIRYGLQNTAGIMPSGRPVMPNVDAERKIPQAVVRYGMPNIGGKLPPAPPNVRYESSSSDDRLAEATPHEASRDQLPVKFSQQGGYYESPSTVVSYNAQEAPYQIHGTSSGTSVVPANVHYEARHLSNAADSWPLPPPNDHYGAPGFRNEFSVSPSVSVQPVSVPQLQNAGDGSRPLSSEVHPRVQNVVAPVAPGMPSYGIRPKKQPPPIAAKPKLPVGSRMAVKTADLTKDEGKQLKPEKMQQKILEIQRLESRPYLTTSEQTRLRNLRVEVEFDKRLADLNEKREDDGDLPQSRMFPPVVRFLLALSSSVQ